MIVIDLIAELEGQKLVDIRSQRDKRGETKISRFPDIEKKHLLNVDKRRGCYRQLDGRGDQQREE